MSARRPEAAGRPITAGRSRPFWSISLLALILAAAGCGDDASQAGRHGGGHGNASGGGRRGPGGGMPWAGGGPAPAVPVEVATVELRSISSFIETNGVLEADNEVDLVARTSAPIVELLAEEGMAVKQGQTLARLDELELRAQVEISRVTLNEATLAYERAKELRRGQLISEEQYEQAKADFESAEAQLAANQILFGYTDVQAPFDGVIVARYVDLAQQVSTNTPLFRISDFDPLLCPIQVPERELPRLRIGQRAYVTLEPWPDERFDAAVLRIRPVVDAATGTVKVTLEVQSKGKLRPGMFARVFLETATRTDALVIPKAALSLESIGDTVYVADDGAASRREVALGFREGDFVEIVSGLAPNESVVVVGQDGLSDGTPIQVLDGGVARATLPPRGDPDSEERQGRERDLSAMGPEQLERMKARGMSEEQIEARIKSGGPGPGGGGRPGRRPDFSSMSPEQLDQAKEFMRARGMSEEQIEARIKGEQEPSEAAGR